MIVASQHLQARRLARLGSRRGRDGLAETIDALIVAAERPPARSRVAPHRHALRANTVELRLLASRLRGPAPLDAHVLADLTDVLTDGTGPVYTGDAQALSRRIARIDRALAPRGAEPAEAA